MDEKEPINESSAAPDETPAVTEEPQGARAEAPERPERKTGRKRYTAKNRAQIFGIQKRKRTAAGGGEGKRGGRHEIVEKRDIRYRGPLSSRHLKILGWMCIVLSQVSFLLSTAGRLDPSVTEGSEALITVGSYAGSYFLPLMLLANFSDILSAKQDFKALLLKFGGLSVLTGLAMLAVYDHYIAGLAGAADRLTLGLGAKFLLLVRNRLFRNGYLACNIFVDLFLCTLFLFFLTYHFRRPVSRGRMIAFRALSILPVAYELACIVLKTMCKNGNITLPLYVSPLLTTKPPMMFAAFIVLALFIKRRERIFLQNGRTYEEYGRYLGTNANSLHFSVCAFLTFITAALIDLLLLAFILVRTTGDMMAAVEMPERMAEGGGMITDVTSRIINVGEAAGVGESLELFLIAPLALLYSYTRKRKNTLIDLAIPAAGVAAIAALYAEAFFQAACQMPDVLNLYLRSTFGFDLSQTNIADLEQILMTMLAE